MLTKKQSKCIVIESISYCYKADIIELDSEDMARRYIKRNYEEAIKDYKDIYPEVESFCDDEYSYARITTVSGGGYPTTHEWRLVDLVELSPEYKEALNYVDIEKE